MKSPILRLTTGLTCLLWFAFGSHANTLTNWARIGIATQSSKLDNSANPEASKAIDGNTSGAWGDNSLTHTATGDAGEWWQVDLKDSKPVGHIHLWFREDCCYTRNENLHIIIYDSTNTTTRAVLWETNTLAWAGMTPRDIGFDISPVITGRVVFIEHLEGMPDYVSLAECEVFNQPLVYLANYALGQNGGMAISSSVYNGDADTFGPQQAIDGNHMGLSGVSASPMSWGYSAPDNATTNPDGTLADALPWWQVDLTSPQTIGSVVLWPRRDRTTTRFLNLLVTVSNATPAAIYQEKLTVQPAGPKYVINFVPPLKGAKTVRVETTPETPDKFLNLPEVEALAPLASAPAMTFVTDLVDVAVEQNRAATFGPVVVTVDGGIRPEDISYSWYRNGVEIPNMAGSWLTSYTTPHLAGLTNSGDKYKVLVSVSGFGVFSSEVNLTVNNDIIPPTIVTNQVEVTDQVRAILEFSELLDPTAATNASNYVLAGGPTVGSLTLGADGKTVTLAIQNVLLGDDLTLTVSGVKDMAGNAMVSTSLQAAIPQTPINYALAGVASQNSTYNHSVNPVAGKAIDGNTAGNWGAGSLSCTANGELGWWEVDLRATKTIGSVKVWWRTDCCGTRNQHVDLVIYDSTNTATRVELLRIPLTGATTPPNPTVLDLGNGQAGQVVHLEHTPETDMSDENNVQMCLAEVQVFPAPNGLVVTPNPSSWNVYAGDRIFLRSGASGQTPISAQWQRDGSPIPGATAQELVITNITAEQEGTYVFVATNAVRTRYSQPAAVVVNPRPALAYNLVARYLFTADDGTNVLDDAPIGGAKTVSHDASNAGALWAASVIDNANVTRSGVLQFDPGFGDQKVAIPSQADLNGPVGTIAFWINCWPANGKACLFNRRGGTNNWGDVLILNQSSSDSPNGIPDTIFDQAYPSGLNVGGITPVADGNWHHFAYVYTWLPFGIVSFYVDGKLDAELTHGDVGAWPLDLPLEFGQSHDSYWPAYTGYMDDIHIFNRTLNTAEIAQLMASGVPELPPSMSVSLAEGKLMISWMGSGYILQQNSNIASTTGWADIPGATTGSYTVTVPAGGSNFYRLRKQ
jgi:hypothetical protein